MKKVLLISFFNSTNVGDLAICDTLMHMVDECAELSIMDISGKQRRSVSIATGEQAPVAKPKCNFYTLKSILSLRKPGRLALAKKLIDHCDIVLLAGGNMIMDREWFSYYSFLCDSYVRYARRKRKKVVMAFVGAGRIQTYIEKRRWRHAIMGCDIVAVRDTLSKERVVSELKCNREIEVWQDPVFFLPPQKKNGNGKRIAINIYLGAVNSTEAREQLILFYIYQIKALRNKYSVALFTTEAMDEAGMHEIYQLLDDPKGVELYYLRNTKEMLEMYQNVNAVLSTRMHAFIIAVSQNTPVISLAWDKKIIGVATDIHMEKCVYDIDKAFENKEDILQAILDRIENPCAYVSEIEDQKKEMYRGYREFVRVISTDKEAAV